ncbi:MAG: tyrosine-type recombinase/integrase [bacterium]
MKTQNRHVACIKSFFDYLTTEGYIINNPAKKIQYGKEPKKLPKPAFSNKEMKKILTQPNINTPLGYRDRTILEYCIQVVLGNQN